MENAKILKYEIYGKFFGNFKDNWGGGVGNLEDFDYIGTSALAQNTNLFRKSSLLLFA